MKVKIRIKSGAYGDMVAFYDSKYHDRVKYFKWHLEQGRNTYYATTNVRFNKRSTTLKLHQLIITDSICVDHVDRNGLNNLEENLRTATIQQNNRNATKQRNNTTGFRGVDYNKDHKAFRARVNVNRKSVYCRYFKTAEEAALAYNQAAIQHFGEYANLNIIP